MVMGRETDYTAPVNCFRMTVVSIYSLPGQFLSDLHAGEFLANNGSRAQFFRVDVRSTYERRLMCAEQPFVRNCVLSRFAGKLSREAGVGEFD
jgi:hypothetical protein